MQHMIKKSQILVREHWTESLVNKLLNKPDHTTYNKLGKPCLHYWHPETVLQAEQHPDFVKKKNRAEAEQAHRQKLKEERSKRHTEKRAGDERLVTLKKTLKSDLLDMVIPEDGSLPEVFDACQAYFLENCLLLKAARTTSLEGYHRVYGPLRDPDINPWCQIYNRIADARQDLAFECGLHFLARLYDVPYEKPWSSILSDAPGGSHNG